jgi:hypothetical protein
MSLVSIMLCFAAKENLTNFPCHFGICQPADVAVVTIVTVAVVTVVIVVVAMAVTVAVIVIEGLATSGI